MKKILAILVSAGLCLGVAACTSTDLSGFDEVSMSQPQKAEALSDSEIKEMYSNPEKFVDRTVTLTGKVFSSPETDKDGVYFQMFHDTENHDLNTVIAYFDPAFDLQSNDYIKVTGIVKGTFEGSNVFGGSVSVPLIVADTLEKSSYAEVVSPALKTITPIDTSITQYNYTVSLTKVEFAKKETRLYFKVENAGKATFNLYSFNAKLVQNGRQYEEETNHDADYPEIQSGLLPGVTTEGIITFPAIDQADFQVFLEAHSDDYDEDFEAYTFDVSVE